MSNQKTPKHRLAMAGLIAFFATLTLVLNVAPIFSLNSKPEGLASKAAGVSIYRTVWHKTKEEFVFTERLKDWSQWEHKFDDKIGSKADGIKYAKEMLESLDDKYTRILDEAETKDEVDQLQGKFVGVGLKFVGAHGADGKLIHTKDDKVVPLTDANNHPVVKQVIKVTPASGAGIKDRDAVASVDGKSTVGMSLDEVVKNIRGPEGTTVNLELQRGNNVFTVKVTRRKYDLDPVSYHKLDSNLGYIRIDSFISANTAADCLQALKALKHCQGYVLDLRSNPGGLVTSAKDVIALFDDEGVVFGVRQRNGDTTYTGQTMIDDSMPHIAAKKPLVILVNGDTASASEIVAGALRDNRHIKLVGTQTFGKGLMQGVFKATNDVLLHVTLAQWLTPNGTCPGSDPKTEHPNGFPVNVTCATGPYFEMDTDKDNQLKAGIAVLKEEVAKSK